MEFHKYRKIFENIKDYKFNSVQHKKLNKENWVITEKYMVPILVSIVMKTILNSPNDPNF